MNQTVTINISGIVFHIEVDAYEELKSYLNKIKSYFNNSQESEEIMADIEARIAELFGEKISSKNQVINGKDVEEIMAVMGKPEQYVDEEEVNNEEQKKTYTSNSDKKVFRNPDERILGGVASGLSAYFGFDTIWMRLFFVLATIFWGFGPILYIVLWIVIPEAKTASDKLKMRGENINIDNIGKTFKEEAGKVGENLKNFNSNKLGHFLEQISMSILNILRSVFRVLGKIIGVIFILAGVFWLLIIAGMLTGSEMIFSISSQGNFTIESNEFFNLIFASEDQFTLALFGAVITIFIPIITIIYAGIKLLFKVKMHYSIGIGMLILWVVGIFMCLTVGLRTGVEYSTHEKLTTPIAINNDVSQFFISASTLQSPGNGILEDRTNFISIDNDSIYQNDIEFCIYKSDNDTVSLNIIKMAQGRSKKEAQIKAKTINFNYQINDSILFLNNYCSTIKKNKIRGQRVKLALYLPIGKSVYIDETLKHILYDVDNVTNTLDKDMIGKTWVMLDQGLTCVDCSEIKGITINQLDSIRAYKPIIEENK